MLHEDENRYCNLFPYDSSRVELTSLASGDYINANWVSLAGVPEHKFILTMAPLHPDSKAEHCVILNPFPPGSVPMSTHVPCHWPVVDLEASGTVVQWEFNFISE